LVSLGMILFFMVLFFFQAEDGIRDLYVTGVQTCALPISLLAKKFADQKPGEARADNDYIHLPGANDTRSMASCIFSKMEPSRRRSEERRVGKECRSRWAGSR